MGSYQKAEKVLYDLAIQLSVRFLLYRYHICIFRAAMCGQVRFDVSAKFFVLMSCLSIRR
jgi:hypothetical protein